MPRYNWSCHACRASNAADADACTTCGFPAVASGRAILTARTSREPGRQGAVAKAQPSDKLFEEFSSLSAVQRVIAGLLVVIGIAAGAVLKLLPSLVISAVAVVVILVCVGLISLLLTSKNVRASG